ncbi:MAG: macro domain-containing protein [Deltaproteobacteria bacterium]|nr:macro domain-containing protein [Deltaproteobacteria bacterium]
MRTLAVGPRILALFVGSITEVGAEAVITAANRHLAGGGGVDGAVHRAAGPRLLEACRGLPADAEGIRCPTGQARITPGFDLAPWVVHAVGPVWNADRPAESAALLDRALVMAFRLADEAGARHVAAPAVSTGVYGYPLPDAARISVAAAIRSLRSARSVERITFALLGTPALRAFEDALAAGA